MNVASPLHRPCFPHRLLSFTVVAAAVLATVSLALAENAAIATRVFNGYTRTKLADGSFKPETYAFANGGRLDGIVGDSMNDFPFRQLVGTLAVPMKDRGYVSASDPNKTDLLIFVFWGATKGTKDQMETPGRQALGDAMGAIQQLAQSAVDQGLPGGIPTGSDQNALMQQIDGTLAIAFLEQRLNDRVDGSNATLLGFQDDLWKAWDLPYTTAAKDFMHDLQSDRYFVILKAYDFRSAWKEKRRKVLWEARFSIMRRGADFAESLPAMAYQASRYFGEATRGVIRRPLPEVKITYGEAKLVKFEDAKK